MQIHAGPLRSTPRRRNTKLDAVTVKQGPHHRYRTLPHKRQSGQGNQFKTSSEHAKHDHSGTVCEMRKGLGASVASDRLSEQTATGSTFQRPTLNVKI